MKTPPASTTPTQPAPCTPNSSGPEAIPPQWAWHHRALTHLRSRLLQAHAEHAHDATQPPAQDSNDAADMSQEQIDREVLWAELAAESEQLFEIDCALQRIHDGLYGLCEKTGHPISPERLRALPWTRYCRETAEIHETRA